MSTVKRFLAELGEGLYIESIRKGRGKDTPFWDPMYNNELYFEPDTSIIRLACKNGYDNNIGKPMMGTKCLCNNGVCKWTMNKEFGSQTMFSPFLKKNANVEP